MEFSCQGIVIREVAVGEGDKLLTILTSTHGKITALAKGVKKLTNKNAAGTQLFVFSEYEFTGKNGRNILKTAISKELFYNMRSDMVRYCLACYFADILAHVTMENNDETETLRLFLNTLYALSEKRDLPLWLIKGAFELKLMCICGFMPNFSECINCSGDISKGVCLFSFEEAALFCGECISRIKHQGSSVPFSCTVSPTLIPVLNYISLSPISKFLSFKLDASAAGEFSFICENYLLHKTERTYETLRIYKSVTNSLNNNFQENNEKQK